MPIKRHFLGWDGPALTRAAGYLRELFGRGDGGWDLGHVVAVLPAQRAGRRLLELLALEAQDTGQVLTPPQVVTTGQLPELLYEPVGQPAGDLDEHLAWVEALRSMPAEALHPLLPYPPEPDDLPGWWSQAKQVRRLRDDLAGHRMHFADVPRLCEQRGVDLSGEARWAVLDAIEQAYRAVLEQLRRTDKQTERLDAINQKWCALDESKQLVLIAAPDLNDMAAAMLRQVVERVTVLVMAPDEHADGFDELGVFRTAYWRDQRVELTEEQVCFVEKVTDQSQAVLDTIGEALAGCRAHGETLNADQVTVGLGDEAFAGPVRRRLDLAGIAARQAAGTPLSRSRPALLLRALGRFKAERRLDALAELLRHPDLADYLLEHGDKNTHADIGDWLTLLDTYATTHLQGRLADEWLGEAGRRERLKALHDRVEALLPYPPSKRMALPRWSEPIAEVLRRVYTEALLREHVPDENQLAMALEQIASALAGQAELNEQSPTCPQVTCSQAIALTLSRLSEQAIADEHDGPAVELLGYLELALDDAPVLALTGLNEGLIPSSRTSDAFLPDSVRSRLSMHDNAHRYARDLMLLNAIVNSRPRVKLIAARRSDEDDPLPPSRLLLACDDATLIKRVQAFFDEDEATKPPVLPLVPGGVNRFLIHRPPIAPEPLRELPVTAFRAYLACPYRFYLRYVLRLASLDDTQVEMDPMSFGSVAHDVLQAFGQGDMKDETDAECVARELEHLLDQQIERRFGRERRPAVRIQAEQLRHRLQAFAFEQARLAKNGWRIVYVEQDLQAEIHVDGEPFTIKGKVDRIDRHDTHGWRVYDYKTGDKGYKPDETHRQGSGDDRQWLDLQLPLYRDLCAGLGVEGELELAYFNLPKKLDDTGPQTAGWNADDLSDAIETRDRVIRDLRAQKFWPPAEPPRWQDGFERLCADKAMQRNELISQSDLNGGGA